MSALAIGPATGWDGLDLRFGKVRTIRPLSETAGSPRRKFCVITADFPGVGVLQSVGQFARHVADMKDHWALCLINLGPKAMFGHSSEMLVLGAPHPEGGILADDGQEAQATFLQSLGPAEPWPAGPRKPLVAGDSWRSRCLRTGRVVGQREDALEVWLPTGTLPLPLEKALGFSVMGQDLVVACDPGNQTRGLIPRTGAGDLLLAGPRAVRVDPGARIY